MHPASPPRPLGRTQKIVGPIGLAAGYGCPGEVVERAFDLGINYFYWGSVRRGSFAQGLRNILPRRDEFVLVVQTYSRVNALIPWSVERALRKLGTDHADVLLLGLWNRKPSERTLETCIRLRDRGLVRHLALSTHHRPLIPDLNGQSPFDVFHLRYNAVHTGAEREVFPQMPAVNRPGLVAFTATSWRQLLRPGKTPAGARTPTAADCYRFVLTNPAIDVCMAGPSNLEQFQAVTEALQRGAMSPEEMEWMRRVGSAIYGNKNATAGAG